MGPGPGLKTRFSGTHFLEMQNSFDIEEEVRLYCDSCKIEIEGKYIRLLHLFPSEFCPKCGTEWKVGFRKTLINGPIADDGPAAPVVADSE